MTHLLVLVETDQGVTQPATFEALTFARPIAETAGVELHALVCGEIADHGALAEHGVAHVHLAQHEMLHDFGPETWGHTLAELIDIIEPSLVLASGTSKGNEVLATAAARLGVAFVANCLKISDDFLDEAAPDLVRVQWGGSLLEEAKLDAPVKIISVAHHSLDAAPAHSSSTPDVKPFRPTLDERLARTIVVQREIAEAGVTLATAPVVVGGGRAMGSAEAFAPLEELASLLGGRVGCSRAVTNNGWRPHSDQVGQTGTRIAPDLYIASGISGAIQHWVGAMASKNILAVNTDPEANMVLKADYAVIGDLHEVIPAVIDEIKRRRAQ